MPKSASSDSGRLHHKNDDSEVPDLLVSSFDYNDFVMTLEHSNYPHYMKKTTMTIHRKDLLPYWTQNATRIELYGSMQKQKNLLITTLLINWSNGRTEKNTKYLKKSKFGLTDCCIIK